MFSSVLNLVPAADDEGDIKQRRQRGSGSSEERADAVPEGDEGDGEEDAEPAADREGGRAGRLHGDVAWRQRIQARWVTIWQLWSL